MPYDWLIDSAYILYCTATKYLPSALQSATLKAIPIYPEPSMSAAVTLYHNPRCSKSRAALAMLQLRGLKAHIVNYLDTPPSQSDIRQLLDQLNADSPRQMMRCNDALYAELNLAEASDEALIAAMAAHPALIERPIAVVGNRAAVGRPLENIEALLP